jgi:hypothetical protein
MIQPRHDPSNERIVETMIQLARAARSHRLIVAGTDSAEVFGELNRRGYPRVTTTKTCRAPFGPYDAALVVWREPSMKALETTLDWLVHLLTAAGVLVVWVGRHEPMSSQALRLLLERLGFRIESGTRCEGGVAISARRLEQSPNVKAA